jgi:hypothetical protein
MDRRDALKKLGMGGATVVGATMVMSSPAFAEPGTPTCAANSGNPAVTISGSGNANLSAAQVTITMSGVTGVTGVNCPCTGTATASGAPYDWRLAGAAPASILGNTATWTGLNATTRAYTFRIRVRCTDSASIPSPVCAIWTGGGNVTTGSGGSGSTITQPTGSLAYDPSICA